MIIRTSITVAMVAGTLLLSGCVTGRRSIPLPTPSGAAAATTKGNIAITQSTDLRKFENNPSSPSIPSVDGDVAKMPKEQLKTMIGRQRNGFGKAMGDIELAAGDNVEMQAKKLVAEGLKRRGYTSNDSPAINNAQVKVQEFWAWFTPGFATVTFESQIKVVVTLTVNGKKTELVIPGYGKNAGAAASNANWQLTYQRAFEDFLKNFDIALTGVGF